MFLGVTYHLFDYFEMLHRKIDAMLWSLFYVIGIAMLSHRLLK